MPMDTPIGLPQVSTYILDHATASDLDRISSQIRQRHTILREQSSADVQVGSVVELADLKPGYLNGLRGTVNEIHAGRGGKKEVTLRLDQKSVTTLGVASNKFAHIMGQDSYDLRGIPLLCCRPVTG